MDAKSLQSLCKRAVVILVFFIQAFVAANAQQIGETITIDQPANKDLYLAGKSIYILSDINGDLISAGRRITIEQSVSGDVIAAGEQLTLRGQVDDDVRLAGRIISLFGSVKDDALIAGETISLAPDATVGGRMWVAGRTVEVAGTVTSEFRAAANSIIISGAIKGDVSLFAEHIEILSGANIEGNLVYRSHNEASIAAGAKIIGSVKRKEMDASEPPDISPLPIVAAFYVSLFLFIWVVGWVAPTMIRRSSELLCSEPFKCLGIGLVAFLVMPVLAILLLVTVVGISLGLSLLAISPVALLVGLAIGIHVLGEQLLGVLKPGKVISKGWKMLGVALVILLLMVAQFIPILGGLVLVFITLGGFGGLILYLFKNHIAES